MRIIFSVTFVVSCWYSSLALADSVVWSGEIQFGNYTCGNANKDEIVVHGDVKIVNSKDVDPNKPPLVVPIQCEKLTFETGSSLSSMSAMDIRISKVTSGPVKLVSLRGIRGGDAKPTPDIWAPVKMKHGDPVGPGPGGHGAKCDPFDSHDSTVGGGGPGGNGGEDGHKFKAPKGAYGDPGATASDITLLTASFAPGSSVEVTAIGGDGGAGGRGGRGADGGDASDGGPGGTGEVPAVALMHILRRTGGRWAGRQWRKRGEWRPGGDGGSKGQRRIRDGWFA